MFDNHRLLHGRTSYDSSEGARHLQGCYLEFDSTDGKLRHLHEKYHLSKTNFMTEKNVKFKHMKDGDKEDYLLLQKYEEKYVSLTYERIIEELTRQGKNTMEGYKITRLDHGLQSATRAYNDGADIDWIVGALLHDIGDGLAPQKSR